MVKSQYLFSIEQTAPYLLIGLILIPITFFSNWGPIDDWHMLKYLINNIPRSDLINSALIEGRFYPLYWSEWKILSNISINPYLFYFFNFIEAFIGCSILYYIAGRFSNKKTGILLISFLIFSPAFIESYYRLGVPDKNSFFLFALGLYFFTSFLFSYNSSKMNLLNLLFGIAAINLALYFKEPGFVIVSIFSVISIFFIIQYSQKQQTKNKNQILTALIFLLISVLFFIILYLSNMNKIEYLYFHGKNSNFFSGIFQSLIVLTGYLLLDPLIIFVGPILLFIRIKNRNEINNFLNNNDRFYLFFADSAIVAALFYALFYITYGIITYRYLLPAYAFIIPAYAIYVNTFIIKRKDLFPKLSNKVRKFVTIVFVLLLLNSITTGINLIMVYKYVPHNMNEFLENTVPVLKQDISESRSSKNVTLFLAGVNRGSGVEYYYSMGTFLNIGGIDANRFDFKSMDTTDSDLLFNVGTKGLKYTAYQSSDIQIPVSGDYLIVIPFISYKEDDLIRSIQEKYDISLEQLYKSKNTYYFQIPNGIMLGRYLMAKMGLSRPVPLFTNVGYSLYRVK